ncbi:hypothetical protein Aph01nite_22370 [Acrocarpospora phusangensis]|uniref:Uncharacterized protein n=1 Tax=Acrocarpospora phusangensis TaxID=1070424 RepID=A0A919UN00_9ACTN|nr:hypothetical protein Aph01nite_22370 [Acrocarpospora phusangensis]
MRPRRSGDEEGGNKGGEEGHETHGKHFRQEERRSLPNPAVLPPHPATQDDPIHRPFHCRLLTSLNPDF